MIVANKVSGNTRDVIQTTTSDSNLAFVNLYNLTFLFKKMLQTFCVRHTQSFSSKSSACLFMPESNGKETETHMSLKFFMDKENTNQSRAG